MVTPTNQKEKQDFEHNIYQLIGQVPVSTELQTNKGTSLTQSNPR